MIFPERFILVEVSDTRLVPLDLCGICLTMELKEGEIVVIIQQDARRYYADFNADKTVSDAADHAYPGRSRGRDQHH